MQRFGQVADGVTAQGEVLDQAQDAHAVLGGHIVTPLEVFFQLRTDQWVLIVGFGGQCDQQTAGQVLRQAGHLVGDAGDLLLAHVRQELIAQVGSRGGGQALMGGGNPGGVDGLVEVGHLDQLIADVGGLFHPVIFRHRGGGPDEHIPDPALADVAAPVEGGEALHQQGSEPGFTVHEDQIVGDKSVLKDDQSL